MAGIVTVYEIEKSFYLDGVKYIRDEQLEEQVLGKGSFGVVKKVSWHGLPCAAKEFHRELVDGLTGQNANKALQAFQKEAFVWAFKLRHSNIVQFFGVWERGGNTAIVMELLSTSLDKFLEEYVEIPETIPVDLKRAILLDVCRAMTYLHSLNIMHRDLKGQNILLTESFKAKVSDFGTVRLYDHVERRKFTAIPGTPDITAPEAFKPPYDLPIDVFSYGCLIIHTLTHKWPTPDANTHLTEYERRRDLLDCLTFEIHQEFQPLIQRCLGNQPLDRPKFPEIQTELSKTLFVDDKDRHRIMDKDIKALRSRKSKSEKAAASTHQTEKVIVHTYV
jgi:serine/threonine protein kinase